MTHYQSLFLFLSFFATWPIIDWQSTDYKLILMPQQERQRRLAKLPGEAGADQGHQGLQSHQGLQGHQDLADDGEAGQSQPGSKKFAYLPLKPTQRRQDVLRNTKTKCYIISSKEDNKYL